MAFLNQRLQQAFRAESLSAVEIELQMRMLVAYVCKWLRCHSLSPYDRADPVEWPSGPTASFMRLARTVLAEAESHPEIRQEMRRDFDVIREWGGFR